MFLMDNDIILLEGQEYFTKMAMDVSSVLDIVRKKGYFKSCGKFNIYYEFYINPCEKAAIFISHGQKDGHKSRSAYRQCLCSQIDFSGSFE